MNRALTICRRCSLVLELIVLPECVAETGAFAMTAADHWTAEPACRGASFGVTAPAPLDPDTLAAFRMVGRTLS